MRIYPDPIDMKDAIKLAYQFPSFFQASRGFADGSPARLSVLHAANSKDRYSLHEQRALKLAISWLSETPLTLRDVNAISTDPVLHRMTFLRPIELKASEYFRHFSKIPDAQHSQMLLQHLPPPPKVKGIPEHRQALHAWPPHIPVLKNRHPFYVNAWEMAHQRYLDQYQIRIYAFACDTERKEVYTQWLSPITGVAATIKIGTRRATVLNIWEDEARTKSKHHVNPTVTDEDWYDYFSYNKDEPIWVPTHSTYEVDVTDQGFSEIAPLASTIAGIPFKQLPMVPRTLVPSFTDAPTATSQYSLFNLSWETPIQEQQKPFPRNGTPFSFDINDKSIDLRDAETRKNLPIHPDVQTAMVQFCQSTGVKIPPERFKEFIRQEGYPLLDSLLENEPLW